MAGYLFICSMTFLITGSVLGRSADNLHDNALLEDEPRSLVDNEDVPTSFLGTDIRFLFRIYNDCSQRDMSSCLKMKLVTALDRAAKSQSDLKVFEGVTFARDPSAVRDAGVDGKPISEEELDASLPRGLQDKEEHLDELIMEKILGFFRSHILQFKLPTAEELQRSLAEEGRGKKKKGASLLLVPLFMAGTLIPIALAGLALLAGKALIVSKLALVLAGIIGLKKLLGGSGGGQQEASYQVVSGHAASRSSHDPHLLAYRSYAPS